MRVALSVYLLILFGFFSPVHAESHHPQEFLKKIGGAPDEGMQIYNHFCLNCHAEKPLINLGAPRIGHKEDWSNRLAQGFDILFQHTDTGFRAMPPRGGCFECSDKQLALAIISMVPEEDKKDLLNALQAHKKYRD